MLRETLVLRLEEVFEAVRRECAYAAGWGKDRGEKKKDSITDPFTGSPYTPMDWMVFAEKYIHEAKLSWANYTPDRRAVTVRLLKAGYLLLMAVAVTHTHEQIRSLGGYSSNRYPILHGGLERMTEELQELEPEEKKKPVLQSEVDKLSGRPCGSMGVEEPWPGYKQ